MNKRFPPNAPPWEPKTPKTSNLPNETKVERQETRTNTSEPIAKGSRPSATKKVKSEQQATESFEAAEAAAEVEIDFELINGMLSARNLSTELYRVSRQVKSSPLVRVEDDRGMLLLSIACIAQQYHDKITAMEEGAEYLRKWLNSSAVPNGFPSSRLLHWGNNLEAYGKELNPLKNLWKARVKRISAELRQHGITLEENEIL